MEEVEEAYSPCWEEEGQLYIDEGREDLDSRIKRMINWGDEAIDETRGKQFGQVQVQVENRRNKDEGEDKEAMMRDVVFGGSHSLSVTVRNKIRGRREEESRREEEGRKKEEEMNKEHERIMKQDRE